MSCSSATDSTASRSSPSTTSTGRRGPSASWPSWARRSGSGLLLDLHNLHTNAVNHGFDPFEFLETLPLERVGQIHLAGGREDDDGYRYDSHSAPPPEPVWELLHFVAARTELNAVILEWDQDLPSFEVIEQQVARAKQILGQAASVSA